ncbi:class II aldolase/adducin family protein [Ilumatobacter sp.]|uniref:class II aldolase/adducin family protein n=2 Tax=Ilumatobacter sp. TaxID=1967498 RepID=UPI00375364E2
MTAPVDRLRHELAGALRLADRFGFSEGICNHFSAVAPSDAERFLINPLGLHWSEISPDDLLLIDGDGEVEATALHIHVAGHRANPRHRAIMHVHMPYATALTMVAGGRLEMAHQTAVRFHRRMTHIPLLWHSTTSITSSVPAVSRFSPSPPDFHESSLPSHSCPRPGASCSESGPSRLPHISRHRCASTDARREARERAATCRVWKPPMSWSTVPASQG